MPSSSRFRRHFLTWERPWLPQVTAWLARDWRGNEALDLSHTLAIVPTRQSGRRLREALAEHAAKRGAAVFPPRTHTADTLLALSAAGPNVASRLECLLAWTEVLRNVDLDAVAEVFPVAPPVRQAQGPEPVEGPRRDFAWAWRLAANFFRLQTELTEGGLAFADVAARAGDAFPEAERWRQLAELEEQQIELLAAQGRCESHEARRAFAREPMLPPGVEQVVVLASPDPLPLAETVLEIWAASIPVDVVIYAPATEAGVFDHLGRPLPAAWERRVLELPEFEKRVRLCAQPADEAEQVIERVRPYPEPDGVIGVGIADPEVLPLLENAFSRAGIAHYNPEGRFRRTERLHALLTALATLAREASFEALATLARCPDFLVCLKDRYGAGFSIARFLAELDELRAAHLPSDLAAAQAMAPEEARALRAGLDVAAELQSALVGGEFPENAIAALGLLFKDRRFNLTRNEDAEAAEAASAWREIMRDCAEARAGFGELSTGAWWDVALSLYGEDRRTEDKPPGALELQGWLELLWEDAPHLVVVGLNDGLVPDAIVGDAFLPESLRGLLGLKTNAARFARDAYLLQALAASRAKGGRLDLLLAKNSATGDPLRPSRLLLRCDDAELPERVAFLFRPAEAARPNLPWRRAWKLMPRAIEPPAHVRVTGLRTWLMCPFRFYLAQVLKMEPVDPGKSEMDARDFGTLCHVALEAMALEPAMRDCVDEAALREFLLAEFDRAARAKFGDALTLPLVVQLESARQRLAKVARVQARERAAGWVIERAEWTFALAIAGLEVRGKIDRIDRHESTGAWRVLDYKTTDAATPPHKSHLRPFRAGERLPEWMRVELNGRMQVWSDLQLPVYLRALDAHWPGASGAACGYINLPKAASETALALWTDLSPGLLAAAHACADGVAEQIRAGVFWPPAEIEPDRDAFAALFHHGADDSVAWEGAR